MDNELMNDMQNLAANRRNKICAWTAVILSAALSCVMIFVIFSVYTPDKRLLNKKTVSRELCEAPKNDAATSADTVCCTMPLKPACGPVVIYEESYNNAESILFYIIVLIFVMLSVSGSFTMLFKTLRFENECKAKIFEVRKDLYKELQLWELTKQKKIFEKQLKSEKSETDK